MPPSFDHHLVISLPLTSKPFADALVSRGDHPLANDIMASFNYGDARVKQHLTRCVNMITHWCEALACSPFLPTLMLPLARFFGRDEQAVVEASIMFIINWAPAWFEFWPAPPLHVLAVAERLAFLQVMGRGAH